MAREIRIIDGKKECSRCKEVKPVDQFFKSGSTKCGLESWCKDCKYKHNRGYKGGKSRKPIKDGKKHCSKCDKWLTLDLFSKNKGTATGYDYYCKFCNGTKRPNQNGKQPLPVVDGRKQCTTCGEWKSLERFEKSKACHLGRTGRCNKCAVKDTNKWFSANIDNYLKRLVNSHNQNRKHRSKHRCKSGVRTKDFWGTSCVTYEFIREMWNEQGGRCAVTGIEMTHVMGEGRTQTNVSIDRIDSSIGYEVGNVQLVCKAVNVMKNELGNDDLVMWCKRILAGLEAPS